MQKIGLDFIAFSFAEVFQSIMFNVAALLEQPLRRDVPVINQRAENP
jgi:hypothetical protein